MIEWQIKPMAKKSFFSEKIFSEGDLVSTYLFRNAEGELDRVDILLEEEDQFSPPERLLGKWTQETEDINDGREKQQLALKSAEELFLSLYSDDVEKNEENAILKQLLALKLERKRILRGTGYRAGQTAQEFLHIKTKVLYEVPLDMFDPEKLLELGDLLDALLD